MNLRGEYGNEAIPSKVLRWGKHAHNASQDCHLLDHTFLYSESGLFPFFFFTLTQRYFFDMI